MLYTILLILLILLLIGGLPAWPYAQNWGYGYYPSGIFLVLIIVLLIVALRGGVWGP